jgi:hypothetical protein
VEYRRFGPRSSDAWIVTGLAVVLAAVIGAMGSLWSYKSAPGTQSAAPSDWPAASRIERRHDLPTLVMFAHPMCTCTRASLSELRVLLSEFQGRVEAHVVFALPEGIGRQWNTTETWAAARSIPGVRVGRDAAGREAALFGGETSGDVVLYDRDGHLMFRGGITGARGHVGDNEGRLRLASILRRQTASPGNGPVFGCPLDDPNPDATSS